MTDAQKEVTLENNLRLTNHVYNLKKMKLLLRRYIVRIKFDISIFLFI